jgi:cell division protein FtsL
MLGLLGGILLAGAISGLCFLYLWQGNRIRELTAVTEQAREDLEAEQAINRVLGVRIDEAFSLERIARIAREQLGMSEPTIVRYVSIPTEESD